VQSTKTPPKGAAVFVAECLARDKFLLDQHHGDETAAELLGMDNSAAVRKQVESLGTGGDARAQVIVLGLVLGSMEARLCGVSRRVHCSLVSSGLGMRAAGTGVTTGGCGQTVGKRVQPASLFAA
jgi:hypothetical protein